MPIDVHKVRRSKNVHQSNLRNKEVSGETDSDDLGANNTESAGSESNDIGDEPELNDPGSNKMELEQDDTKESRQTESDVESENGKDEEDDGGAKKFFYNLYYNLLTGIFHDLGVILKFVFKSVSIIKNFFEELWVKIKRMVKKFVKETLEKIDKLLKAIWEKISQEYYPTVLDFVGVWSLEIFLVITIVSVWSCFFNHYVVKKHKMKKKKRKEKEKATIFANACAGLVELDLENGSSYLSNDEFQLGSRTGDEIVGAEEGGSIIETIPEGEEESTECSTSISTEDDTSTLVTSNASAQV